MTVRHLAASDFRTMPWANGRGTTVEVVREERDGGLLWRVSIADVVEDGAFSPLPGIDRILTLIEGAGFDLDFGGHGRVAPLLAFTPVAFSGDWATRAENVRGPSRDLNLMTARGRARGSVTIRDRGFAMPSADRTLLLALNEAGVPSRPAASWSIAVAGTDHAIAPGEALIVREPAVPIAAKGTGRLAVISVAFSTP